MLNSFKQHIERQLPFLQNKKLILTISGGIDSVVLAHLCHKLGLNFALAHCNFNLRGDESDADEAFLVKLADDLDVEIFIESFDTNQYAADTKLSIQMAARELRYRWFEELVDLLHFDYVLTAHHADDNLETFLINLSRGTGIEGLTGIPEINDYIVRPLLPFSRTEIIAYAEANGINWREDSSNNSTKYLRNKLRHDVIPVLKEINPQWLQNFKMTQNHLHDSKILIDDFMTQVYKDVVAFEADVIKFDISKLLKYPNPKPYLYQLLKSYKFTAWDDIYNLLEAQSGKQVFSETHRLLKDREYLILSLKDAQDNNVELHYEITEDLNPIKTAFGTFSFSIISEIQDTLKDTIYVDFDKLEFPLTIRKWEQGDFFFPLGMQGKKKLSKYFKDEKLSLVEKEHVWVVCSGNDIVWVINRRGDNRFKVTTTTKQILKISYKQVRILI
ncbi:tRNA(Ile)-lysidine synthetase [Formosa agariphila KMM 3901]|uniref:tRNA(Ile)-lysidine synthase n=1 Tax=Formosa agariphila (strain DSM 15362 / KCTC 12365 / LMG 23005 / KMM 3901 / M-2Alg 35-1) TaxID=1347342 RepID=T2KMZ8_FORAG|nr:tRNA lysidine(34) synthetase TilS [Formosa agariphila]CDF80135.1 tRNA(Ile)-lysidine synthetase [Formosa agariphila KMM 3901]